MASTDVLYEDLSEQQQKLVQRAFGFCDSEGKVYHCSGGCVTFLGNTKLGQYTYFWDYGASEGYLTLPLAEANPHLDYSTLIITTFTGGTREWTTDGEEMTPPFQYLCHVDTRKLEDCEENLNAGSYLPEHAAARLELPARTPIDWVGHLWLAPWEMTKKISDATIALTIVYPDDRRVVVI